MTLRQKQSLFVKLLTKLLLEADELGFEVTLGEAYRSPEEQLRLVKAGLSNLKPGQITNHTNKLAIDLNLFLGGKYLSSTESHKPLGEFWKSLHPLCRWGGDFKPKPDGNHYSLEHNGIK